jgi:hypothetical protein
MAPIAYRPSAADHTGASPEGYLANLLLSRRIPGLATYTIPPPSPRQVQDVLAAWSRLLTQDGLGVLYFLQSRVGGISPNDGEMRGLLRGLSVHTLETSQYVSAIGRSHLV